MDVYLIYVLIIVISLLSEVENMKLNDKEKRKWRKMMREKALKSQQEFSQNANSILYWVGSYIAAHKYFGVDFREDRPKSLFYKQFAIPVLEEFHSNVKSACEESVLTCIKHVYVTAYQSSTMFNLHDFHFEQFEDISFPLSSEEELSRYRMTASYYLCYYTLRRESLLSPVYANCLSYFSSGKDIKDANGQVIFDIRQSVRKPFSCAMAWFCPDPCYGRLSGGTVQDLATDSGNPCLDLPNNNCIFPGELNDDFSNLIGNKLNVSCDCSTEMKGYTWNQQYNTCTDIDECMGNATCPVHKKCINIEGGYVCE